MGYRVSDNIFERRTEDSKITIGFCNTILFISIFCMFFGFCFTFYRFTNLYDYKKATVTNVDSESTSHRTLSGKRHYSREITITYTYEDKVYNHELLPVLDYLLIFGSNPSSVYVNPDKLYNPITSYRMWGLPVVLDVGGTIVTITTAVKRHKLKKSLYTY